MNGAEQPAQIIFPESVSGPQINIVLLADGYTVDQEVYFICQCKAFANFMKKLPWFDVFMKAISIYAIPVHSLESGISTADEHKNNYFGTHIDNIFNIVDPDLLSYNKGLVTAVCNEKVPGWHAAALLVNSDNTDRGRANADPAARVTAIPSPITGNECDEDFDWEDADWMDIVVHELGHALFSLADEYDSYSGCNSDLDVYQQNPPVPIEPSDPNVTNVMLLNDIKWRHHITDAVFAFKNGFPTVVNAPNCEKCQNPKNPFASQDIAPADAVGSFEGAGYYHCGNYRPSYNCRMRTSYKNFCTVCLEAIYQELAYILPLGPLISAEPKGLKTLHACIGSNSPAIEWFRIANLGNQKIEVVLSPDDPAIEVTPNAPFTVEPGQFVQCSARLKVLFVPTGYTTASIEIKEYDTGESLTEAIPLAYQACEPKASPYFKFDEKDLDFAKISDFHDTLDFGRVVRGHTTYRRLLIKNKLVCCGDMLTAYFDEPYPPDYFKFENESSTPPIKKDFIRPEYNGEETVESIWFSFTASPELSLGTKTAVVEIRYDQLEEPQKINLRAVVVDPEPLDMVLVMDRSTSMADLVEPNMPESDSRLQYAFDAVEVFVGLLRDNDNIAMVRYNEEASSNSDILSDLKTAGPIVGGQGRNAILSKLNVDAFDVGGHTSLGAGVRLGSQLLEGGDHDRRSIVLLTDGRANRAPALHVEARFAADKTPSHRIYAVALQLQTEELGEELQKFKTLKQDSEDDFSPPLGEVMISGINSSDLNFRLKKFYTQIIADETRQAFVLDPVSTLMPGNEEVTKVALGEVDYDAHFILAYRPQLEFPKYLNFIVETPSGTPLRTFHNNVEPPNYVSGSVSRIKGHGWQTYQCRFPVIQEQTTVGTWRLHVINQSQSPLTYSLMVISNSDLLVKGRVNQEEIKPGSEMEVVIEPRLYDAPAELVEPVVVRVTRPDGISSTLELAHQDDGTYRGVFADTENWGNYQFAAEVLVTTPLGITVPRVRYMTGFIKSVKSW